MTKCPLILIAGWGYPSSALAGVCRVLTPEIRAVSVAPHELGAEESEEPGLSRYATALLRLIREQDGKVSLAGWSMGGLVALEVAVRHPELVDRLALIASTPKFCGDKDFLWGVPAANVRAMRVGLRHNPEKTMADFYRLAGAPFREPVAALPELGSGWREELTAGLDYLMQTDLRDRLTLVGAPVLILHGREDRVIPWPAAEYTQRELPDSRLSLYAGVGHDFPLREPDRVAGEIIRFLC